VLLPCRTAFWRLGRLKAEGYKAEGYKAEGYKAEDFFLEGDSHGQIAQCPSQRPLSVWLRLAAWACTTWCQAEVHAL
jgi:hypothetical protein